jgi:emfourin
MRIDFRMEGGLAALPGLAAPVTIHCDALPAGQRDQLRALLQRADFFARPADDRAPAVPDARTYTIVVDDGANCRQVTVREPIRDAAMRDLVAALRDRALAARRAR